jgi:hypothetical protein
VSNDTFHISIALDGFNVRDTWHHATLDMYEYVSLFGGTTGSIDEVRFYIYVPGIGSQVSLLVDDFQIITSPSGDPGFELDWYSDSSTPFAAWRMYSGSSSTILRSTDSFTGAYACNLTPHTTYSDYAGVYHETYATIDSDIFLDMWWRLDGISDQLGTSAQLTLRLAGGYSLNYIFGAAAGYTTYNSTMHRYFEIDGFNATGAWTNLHRNITADVEAGLDLSGAIIVTRFAFDVRNDYAGGDYATVTLMADNIILTDGAPPQITNVEQTPTSPMYYDEVDISFDATDNRPGVASAVVNYTTDDGGIWHTVATTGTYTATIPAQPYGTEVQYCIIAVDGLGLEAVDNNGGLYYSYTVGDDIDPVVSIDSPSNNAHVEGMFWINVTANDASSGIDYVELFANESSIWADSSYPYSFLGNTTGVPLGLYNITVVAHDEAGNLATASINITIVDTESPDISGPGVVAFNEGTPSPSIVWDTSDSWPAIYEIYIDTVLDHSGFWNSSSEDITVQIGALPAGVYNYTCVLYDSSGNSVSDYVEVTVIDAVDPDITTPANLGLPEGDSDVILSWHGTDLHPYTYQILRDSVIVRSGSWNSSSEDVDISLNGLAAGVYNFTCILFDESSNSVSDTVIVTISDETAPTISAPDDLDFNEGTTGTSVSWNGTDLHPATYEILRDSVSIASGLWNASSEVITVSLDWLSPGTYNYTCVFTDGSGNSVSDTVMVTVNEVVTTTTTTTTATTTDTNSTTGGEGDIMQIILIVGGVGIAIAVVVGLVFMQKRKA